MSPISARDKSVWIENISPIWSPMVRSGLSAVIGSWKIIAMPAPRTSRISATRGRAEIAALEHDAAAVDRHAVGQQPHDGVGGHGFAGAGFADHAEDFVRRERQRDISSACARSAPRGQADAQTLEREDGLGRAHRLFSLGLSASLSPWPTSDTASTVSRMAMPGIAETYHCTRSTSRPSPMRLPQEGDVGIGELQEGERAFQQDRDRHHHAGIDDDRRQRIRQHLAEDELRVATCPACGRPGRIRGRAGRGIRRGSAAPAPARRRRRWRW